ncbi:MAG: metallophosphoesterase [Promethearchaeota archaeon]|nr:MAG: metallophosphoesterase [Candidatus Lokiarchaeota archaeon]
MVKILNLIQISDLHYGSEFREEYMENLIGYINDKDPDAVICTGDLVHKGRLSQFEGISSYLKRIKPKLLIVPGNHDAKNNGLLFFEHTFGPRRRKMVIEEKDTILVGLSSVMDDLKDGEIGDEQLLWLAQQFKRTKNKFENRVIALHHHLIPLPLAGRKWTTVRDAGEMLEFTQLFKIDLVLSGHRHVPHAWVIGPTTFLYCGTSSTDKVRADEPPSFNEITLEKGDLEVYHVSSIDLQKSLLLTRKEGRTKYIRPRRTRIEHLLKTNYLD